MISLLKSVLRSPQMPHQAGSRHSGQRGLGLYSLGSGLAEAGQDAGGWQHRPFPLPPSLGWNACYRGCVESPARTGAVALCALVRSPHWMPTDWVSQRCRIDNSADPSPDNRQDGPALPSAEESWIFLRELDQLLLPSLQSLSCCCLLPMAHILIAEDEPRIASFIEKGLKSHGFTTTTVENAHVALSLALSDGFDLLILDLGLPDRDGLEVLADLRGQGGILPVLILTARDDIQDKVSGLEGGADDYMTKPFRFEELLARVRVRLRYVPHGSTSGPLTITAHDVVLDLRTRKTKVNDKWIELPAREFNLAEVFFQHPGQVFSRQQLLDRVWGYDYDPGSNIVDVYVGYLRKKLGDGLIQTVRGVGYRLKA